VENNIGERGWGKELRANKHERFSWNDAIALYLDCNGSYTNVHVLQNLIMGGFLCICYTSSNDGVI
jgi:hypothetical protein